MNTPAVSEHRLLRAGEHEAPDPTENSLREAFALLRPRLRPPFSLRTSTPSDYHQLVLAIVYGALTAPPRTARTHLVHLHAVVTDGYDLFTRTVLRLSLESYPRLLQPARAQLLWVISELIGADAVGVDRLVVSLLRWVRIGDFSQPNLWLAEGLLRVLCVRWDWLLEEPSVLTSALFLYLRLLADHYRLASDQKVEALKELEIDFCVRVVRQHFDFCMGMGRDLVRLLQDVAFIPEFRDVWKDLLFEPRVFGVPGYSDIWQLYRTRTPVQYFLLGITPEMETRMRFLFTHVKLGNQRRYQEWFARKFLCRPECETVVVDLVRFICCAHHPPNEILRSNIIPRWAVIGWLLKSCRKNYFAANAKLALFYDWLFFDDKVDSIMNIEPAILLMLHSVPEYVGFTQELMEFLFLLIDHYDVDRKDLIAQGVLKSFDMVVRKGVVQSLDLLSTCSLISPLLKERFNVFIHGSKPEAVRDLYLSSDVKTLGGPKKSASCEKTGFSHVKGLVDHLRATMTQAGSNNLQTLGRLLVTFAKLDKQAIDKELGGNSSTI
ncbi:hypothetical protein Taro_056742, partial [Colocasia esculenta]|nr:hypothetical protein [Colocasia esculenta]